MASLDDKQLGVARLYARAILEVATEQGRQDEVLDELEGIERLLQENGEFATFVDNPLIERKDRRQVLESTLRGKASDLLVDSLQVIDRKGRLSLLPSIVEVFRQESLAAKGLVNVYVTSAIELNDGLREKLQAAADRFTGKRAQLVESVDPELIGGLVVRVGDDKVDASVATELDRLGGALFDRATAEILSGKSYLAEA